jgi:hypothetical protein
MLLALATLVHAHAGPYTHPAGWTATLPEGWSLTANDGQRAVFVHADGVRSVIATVTFANWATTRAELSNPIDLGGGVQLVPTGPPREADGAVHATYTVPASVQPLSGFTEARALDADRVAVLIGFAPTERVGDLADVVHALAASVRAPRIEPDAPNSWSAYLRDTHWVQLYTGSGYSERHDLWLCANGTYRRHDDLGGFSMDGTSGGAATDSAGTWQVAGSVAGPGQLGLRADDGTHAVVGLTRDGDAVRVEGVRWLRAGPADCR